MQHVLALRVFSMRKRVTLPYSDKSPQDRRCRVVQPQLKDEAACCPIPAHNKLSLIHEPHVWRFVTSLRIMLEVGTTANRIKGIILFVLLRVLLLFCRIYLCLFDVTSSDMSRGLLLTSQS